MLTPAHGFNPNDQYHREVIAIYNDLRNQEIRLLTTDYVIDEAVTRFRYDTNHSVAVAFLEFIGNAEVAGDLTVLAIDKDLFEKAKHFFVSMTRHGYPLPIAQVL